MLTTHPFDDDKLREECGIFGVSNSEGAAALVALGLHGIGIGRLRRDDRTGTREAKAIKQHGMIEKITGQAGARPPAMLFHQAVAALVCCKIQRILVAHAPGPANEPPPHY